MRRTVRLQFLHQNQLFRQCLVAVLRATGRFEVAAWDPTDLDALASVEGARPEVVLINLNLPDKLALEWIRLVKRHCSSARIIALVAADAQQVDITVCLAAGAHGCVVDTSSVDDLVDVIDRVIAGETYCSPQFISSTLGHLAKLAQHSRWREESEAVNLTSRELDILELIAGGMSNKQIAKELSVSLSTVKNHVHNILEKLRVKNRFEAVRYLRQNSWETRIEPLVLGKV